MNQQPLSMANTPCKLYSHTLDNGLHITLGVNKVDPSVAIHLIYHVGARDETPGTSGLAHLFEHLMFQGSQHVPKGGYMKYISQNGGRMNAYTSEELTAYYQVLPPHRVDLGLWLEADRMGGLLLSAENITNQKDVVIEEKLQRDNQPYGTVWDELNQHFYSDFRCQHSVLGEIEDIQKMSQDTILDFYNRFYIPSNAWLSIVGAIDPDQTLAWIHTYFSEIKQEHKPTRAPYNEPEDQLPRSQIIYDELIQLPALMLAYPGPNATHPDQTAMLVADYILAEGASGRLYQRLVKNEELALHADSSAAAKQGPSLYALYAINMGEKPNQVLKEIIEEEIHELANGTISDEELERAKTQIRAQTIYSIRQNQNVASRVNFNLLYHNDLLHGEKELAHLTNLSQADIQKAAQKWLDPSKQFHLDVLPKQ